MDAITNFIIKEGNAFILPKFALGCILFVLLLILFFILLISVTINISEKYKEWKLKALVFLIAVLVSSLTLSILWWDLPHILLLSIYNIIFFLYFLQRLKRLYIAILGIILLNPLIIFSIEETVIFDSLMNCESDYPAGFIMANNKGYYPIQGEVELKICPVTDAPYELTKNRYKIGDDPSLMLAWDGEPHGFIFKWRVVAFLGKRKGSLDRDIRRIPEGEFQKLLKEQQGNNL